MQPVKTSSFQLPSNATVDTVFVKLANGKIVPRHPSELVTRPAKPVKE
jgi:hypothetical protein